MGLVLLLLVGLLFAAFLFVLGIVRDARAPARATIGWALARKLPVDPAAHGLHFEEALWGANQSAWRIPGGDPSSDITTIIIHGWRRSRIDSLRRISPWIEVSNEVWLVDLAGHGDSLVGPTTLGVRDVQDVVTLALAIAAGRDQRVASSNRLLLVGHSLGASIAARAAAQLPPACIAGVVAIAPYESLREPLANRLRARALPAMPFAHLAELWLHAICGREQSVVAALRQLRANEVAAVLIAGSQDTVVRVEHVAELAAAADLPLITDKLSSHDELATSANANATTDWSRAVGDFVNKVAITSRREQRASAKRSEQ